jgi:predicted DCC family thiol-disulfide oxidoreductase YuxK
VRTLPLVIYDGDCGFCRLWLARWQQIIGDRAEYAPYQQVAAEFPEIPIDNFRKAVHLIEPDGAIYSGAAAVFRLLRLAPGKGWMWGLYEHVPGFAAVSAATYRFVAAHRPFFFRVTKLLWGEHVEQPPVQVTRQLFLRLLAGIYLIAFVSLYVQIPGLIGNRGILPVGNLLDAVREQVGAASYWRLPTLAWVAASDTALRYMALGGALAALVAMAGLLQGLACGAMWVLYLSLVTVGQDFLSFQWDILLLETGFLAIWFAFWNSRGLLWLLRLLLFRLTVCSGLVKLASGDPTWRNLTALQYHYETQPLPTPLAWYAHQMPASFQHFSVAVMFGIELFVPLLIFTPRRLRMLGAGLMIGLQVLIGLTGNYAFFNLLTVALCLLLFDDAALPARFSAWFTRERPGRAPGLLRRVAVTTLMVVVGSAGLAHVLGVIWRAPWPAPVAEGLSALSRLYLVNTYGLFAVMTTERVEIIVEGSNDGETWQAYEFKYKPGDIKRAPPVVEPHQPRLDWQMWFAALGDYRQNPWFVNFMVRLLEGSPDVVALGTTNPFPQSPPRYVRARRYEYHFTSPAERRATGAWWRRQEAGLYFPASSLRGR